MAEVPLAQALATATAAAQSATAALEEVRRAQTAGLATKPKELELSGRPEEDRRLWADWRFAATQFLASKDGAYLQEIEQAIGAADPIDIGTLPAPRPQRARLLFTYLCGNVKGRLLAMLREPALATTSNGFEAIRRFHKDIEPKSGAAALGLLEAILTVPPPPKGKNLRDAIVAVERLFSDYEATSSEKLSNHVKIAALRKLLPAEMRVHMNMQIRDQTTYEDLKKAVTEYEVAERRYDPLGSSVYDHQGPMAMEVDQVRQDTKGKKGDKPGKGREKGSNPPCKTCGKVHKGECWYKGSAPAKGAGKGGTQKGKGAGSTKGEKAKCQICGKENHTADKCFQRYKDKDKEKGSSKGGKSSVQQAQDATGATVTGVSRQEADTSPETELRSTTGGVRA